MEEELLLKVCFSSLTRKLLLSSPSWSSLMSSISTWNFGPKEDTIIVYYEDNEGDQIVIEDDQDFQLMLKYFRNRDGNIERGQIGDKIESGYNDKPAIKLYIRQRYDVFDNFGQIKTDKDRNDCFSVNHELQCIVCHEDIMGFRHACLVCDNDLCSRCASRGLHPRHALLRLINKECNHVLEETRKLWREHWPSLHEKPANSSIVDEEIGEEVLSSQEVATNTTLASREELTISCTEPMTTTRAICDLRKEIDKLLDPLLDDNIDDDEERSEALQESNVKNEQNVLSLVDPDALEDDDENEDEDNNNDCGENKDNNDNNDFEEDKDNNDNNGYEQDKDSDSNKDDHKNDYYDFSKKCFDRSEHLMSRSHRSRSPLIRASTDDFRYGCNTAAAVPQTSTRPTSLSLVPNSSNAKFDNALSTMLSMGFDDNDGWLTELITLKKGNVDDVLDVLSPVHANNEFNVKH